MFASLVFYLVAGIVLLAILPMSGFPPQVGIIGILNIVVAYGVLMKRHWTIWFVALLFLGATTFSVVMLYDYLLTNYVLSVSMMVYLVLTWIFTAYVVSKRGSLET